LIKIGYGLYAKTKLSSLNGNTVPVEPLPALAQKALDRLGALPGPSKAAINYHDGHSTQVPTGRLIIVTKRISRKIGYNNISVNYERQPPLKPILTHGARSE
jgi:hypothetical protein